MAVRLSEVFVEIGARTANFQKGINSASRRMTKFGAGVSKVSSDNALALTAFAAAGALAFRSLITTAGDFDAAMRGVAAVSGATTEQFAKLTETAQKLGRETQFSASQAAAGMEFLAKAGFEAGEVIGAIPGTLQLAAAASLDLASAADIVTNVLTGFNLEVQDLSRVNDILTQAFISSNTDLRQLGQAMKFVGPVAAGFGQDIEDVVAVLGSLGNAGIQASMAGTTLRGALTRLASPSREAAKILKRVGIEVFDSAGKMRPFIDILDDLGESAIKAEEVIEVFGQRAGPGITALLAQGAQGIREFSEELRDSAGVTDRIARVKMEGFTGATLELTSAFEGLTIAIGKSGVLELAEGLARGLANLTRTLAELPPLVLGSTAAFAALVTIGAGLLAMLGLAALAFAKVQAALVTLSVALAINTAGTAGLGSAFALATAPTLTFAAALKILIIPLAVLTAGLVVIAAATVKWTNALEEADVAQRSLREGLVATNARMKQGFKISNEFANVTTKQAGAMANLDVVARRLTIGLDGLRAAQDRAKDPGSRMRIQARIDGLKRLREAVLKAAMAQKEAADSVVSAEDLQQRAFKATINERRALLQNQIDDAAESRDREQFVNLSRELVDLENAKVNSEEFKNLFKDKTDAQILEIAREQEARTIGRQFDKAEKIVFDQERVANERIIAGQLTAILQQASQLSSALFNKDLTAKQKKQQAFLQISRVIQQQITSNLVKNLATQAAARKKEALIGVAANKAETASGFFAAFAPLPFIGQALALAAIGAAFGFINSLLTFGKGGLVPGAGSKDTVPALLTPGEFVIPKRQVSAALAGGDSIRGGGFGQVNLNFFDTVIDNEERMTQMADKVGEVIMDLMSGDRRGLVR